MCSKNEPTRKFSNYSGRRNNRSFNFTCSLIICLSESEHPLHTLLYASALASHPCGFCNCKFFKLNSQMGSCLSSTAPPEQTYDENASSNNHNNNKEIGKTNTMVPIKAGHSDYELAISIQNGLYGSLSSSNDINSMVPGPMLNNIQSASKSVELEDIEVQCVKKNEHKPNHNTEELFTEYAPSIFSKLRESFNVSDADFLSILTGDNNGLISFLSNSKSGQYFFFSNNSQFIIKTMNKSELELLLQILPSYYQYMVNEPNSLIARFYGIYTLNKFKINNKSSKDISFLISNNVFYSKRNMTLKSQYDLKGSLQGRKTNEIKARSGSILKDLNFIEDDVRMEIARNNKAKIFHEQIFKDCQWFEKHSIMDYSLLVGIADNPDINVNNNSQHINHADMDDIKCVEQHNDNNNKNIFYQYHGGMLSDDRKVIYFIGIIDILQKYNKKKKVAGFVKGIKYDQITLSTVPPDMYAKRFCEFFKDRVY